MSKSCGFDYLDWRWGEREDRLSIWIKFYSYGHLQNMINLQMDLAFGYTLSQSRKEKQVLAYDSNLTR